MALSLPGERSVAAAPPKNPVRALFAWIAKFKADRARRTALTSLLELDSERLRDLGISRADIHEAIKARNGRHSGMVLHDARARQSRS